MRGVCVSFVISMGMSMVFLIFLLITMRMAVTAISFISVEVGSKMEVLGTTMENLDLNDVEE